MKPLSLPLPCLYAPGTLLTSPGGSFVDVVQCPVCRLERVHTGWRLDLLVQRHPSYALQLQLHASEGYRGDAKCNLTLFWQPPLSIADQVWWYRSVAVAAASPLQSNIALPPSFTANPLLSAQRQTQATGCPT